jgi:dipeptidyl aminopeptidase/acylaminoacyl peptidase
MSLSGPLLSGQERAIDIEQLLGSPFPSELVAAKQSSRVAWVVDFKGERNIWVADGPSFVPRQLSTYQGDEGQPIASLRLTPDGATIVYVRGSEINNGERVADPTSGASRRKQEIWAMNVGGKGPRLIGELGCSYEGCEDIQISADGRLMVWATRGQLWLAPVSGLTPAHQLLDLRGYNTTPRWSPDSKRIAFVSDRDSHSFITIYDLVSNTIQYVSPSTSRDISPLWSPDGKSIAFIRLPGIEYKQRLIPLKIDPWSIWIADGTNGDAREVWHSGQEANDSLPDLADDPLFFFPSNDRILFASEQDGRNHLYSVSVNGGESVLLTPGYFDVEEVCVSPDGQSIFYTSNQGDVDRRHIWRVGLLDGTPQVVTKGDSIEWKPVETADGKALLFLGSTSTKPAMVYRLVKGNPEVIVQREVASQYPSERLVSPKSVILQSADGMEVHGQLFVPTGTSGPRPAMIYLHGGPRRQMLLGFHYLEYYHYAYAMNQYLVSRGYVVLSINFRQSTMYGRAFRKPANAGWRGGAEYADLLAAAKFLGSMPTVNPRKIGLWGGSFGGYLTALGLARNSDLFAVGADFHGVHDWSERLGLWKSGDAPDLEEARKLASQSSPTAWVANWKSPVLLIHGDDDRNVAFSQTVDLSARLRQNHVQVEELIFPDETHDILLWKNWTRAYKMAADFIDRTLQGRDRN